MVESTIPTLQWIRIKIEQLDTDLLREIVQSVAELLMSYDADSRCNAACGQKGAERTNPLQWISAPALGHEGGQH